jgi:hypothetical protein
VTIVEVALFRVSVCRSGARPGLKNVYRQRNADSFGVTSRMPGARFTQNVASPRGAEFANNLSRIRQTESTKSIRQKKASSSLRKAGL